MMFSEPTAMLFCYCQTIQNQDALETTDFSVCRRGYDRDHYLVSADNHTIWLRSGDGAKRLATIRKLNHSARGSRLRRILCLPSYRSKKKDSSNHHGVAIITANTARISGRIGCVAGSFIYSDHF